jgi:uncharacterized protein with HEPN domain
MPHKTGKYLYDALRAAGFLVQFVQGKTFADYEADVLLRSGVERQFEVIGEALNQLADLDSATVSRIPEYQRIISFRNRLIHGYSFVDNRVVWDMLQNRLGVLREQAAGLLREIDPDYEKRRNDRG